jgi:hypothetical protein
MRTITSQLIQTICAINDESEIASAVVQSRLGDSENLRLDRQDRSSDGQNGWLRLYAYSRQELDF